jgi:hypothetical protein
MGNFVEDVLLLGINKIDSTYGLYAALMPFINEFLNLFTLTIFAPYFGFELYPHRPKTIKEGILKTMIDTLAITGIVANASYYGGQYSRDIGFVKGVLYAFFTFFIPNLFMNRVLGSKYHHVNLFLGLVFIYILDIMVHGTSYYYIHHVVKHKEKDKKK